MITDEAWLAIAPLAAQRYSVEMCSLFVGLLIVGFGWALVSGLSVARSIHRTGDLVPDGGDSRDAFDGSCPDERTGTSWASLLRIEKMETESHPPQAAKLADQFQEAVGTLIGMKSPALAECEPAARTFAKTAERTQPLAAPAANRPGASRSDCTVDPVPAKGDAIASPARGASNIAQEVVTQADGHVDDARTSIAAIAERINPPALAAVIAALHAGEAGKGFAVVARELTVLTAQTTKVLEQLGIQIGGMEATTHDPSSASRTSLQASGAPEKVHRRSQQQWNSGTRNARRPSPRPRRRRSGLT
jgi:hypothetical protein